MLKNQEIKKVWIDEYTIHTYEIDVNGKVKFPMLCKYMQESAWHHAENLGVGYSQLIRNKLSWVLAQQLIKIHTFPKWNETIQIHTWPSGRGRLSYLRDFKILNSNNDIVGVATTKWYAINLIHRKPQNIDHKFDYDLSGVEQAFSHQLSKLAPLNSENHIKSFQVSYSNLDLNDHVNNVTYIEWILDSIPLDFQKLHQLKELEIIYLAEAVYDDKLKSYFEKRENSTYDHSLVRDKDQKELCRARTDWS